MLRSVLWVDDDVAVAWSEPTLASKFPYSVNWFCFSRTASKRLVHIFSFDGPTLMVTSTMYGGTQARHPLAHDRAEIDILPSSPSCTPLLVDVSYGAFACVRTLLTVEPWEPSCCTDKLLWTYFFRSYLDYHRSF